MKDDINEGLAMAIHRYEVISVYLVEAPPRGTRTAFLKKLAERFWTRPDGTTLQYSPETLRKWIRRYAASGIHGLKDAAKERPGCRVLPERIVTEACRLKKEVPERSIERIIRILEELELSPKGLVRRSTLHRALKSHGLSARRLRISADSDLDRWQADFANELWQADARTGPWLPDPDRPGKLRQTKLYAFLDDASRLLLHGRFAFSENLPALELVFRRAIQRWGVPQKVYYDNGKTFRSNHMKSVCAHLGIHMPIFTQIRRPMGHGKIEAFNRFCKDAFVAEVRASKISTLGELNEAFTAWAEEEYNARIHSELQTTPMARFLQDESRRRFADEEDLRQAFLWKERRTTDKCAVFSLYKIRYQVSPSLARRRIEVRFDPEFLDEVEVWHMGKFIERVRPLEILRHRRGQEPVVDAEPPTEAVTDYLGHLVRKRRKRIHSQEGAEPQTTRCDLQTYLNALKEHLDQEVFNEELAREFFLRFGPFPAELVESTLQDMVGRSPDDLHQSVYLEEIRRNVRRAGHQ